MDVVALQWIAKQRLTANWRVLVFDIGIESDRTTHYIDNNMVYQCGMTPFDYLERTVCICLLHIAVGVGTAERSTPTRLHAFHV